MNYIDENVTIGEMAAGYPKVVSLFKEYGIDYCCGGHRQLFEVIKEMGLWDSGINRKLEQFVMQSEKGGKKGEEFAKMSPGVLSVYIEDIHHGYLRRTLPKAAELLNTLVRVHGQNHRELFDIYQLFGQLKTDLEQHLLKEEIFLFPALEVEDNKEEIRKLTTEIIAEHESAGEILRKIRQATKEYQVPGDGCSTYAKTYTLLKELEEDLHQHIHLENNVLLREYATR